MRKILTGDALEMLKTLPDESVNCCVTSPPYYGLRDYGIDGQIGLEKTPQEYVQKLVDVFREVRRVLRNDGTFWLNLGDSYVASGSGACHKTWKGNFSQQQNTLPRMSHKNRRSSKIGPKPKNLIGIPWRIAFALQQPYEHHLIQNNADRAYMAGLIDGEGCITILKTKSSHCDSYSYPPIVQIRMCDNDVLNYFADLISANHPKAELYNSQKNKKQRPSYSVKAVSKKAMKLIADVYPYLRVKQKQSIIAYNHQIHRNKTNYQQRTQAQIEREEFCKSLINDLNQKKERDLPSWMVEPTFQIEDGWYLRQDCIWHKPNPMPESVKDRCTKAHEYIFLMSKSARYFYDADAIKEPCKRLGGGYIGGQKGINWGRKFFVNDKVNKRSVWTIANKPYSAAHFATFPPELPETCIKAGCPKGGTVLDPFSGAGTTGMIAARLYMDYIGIDLNPEYVDISQDRIYDDAPLFANLV
jgi:DNA modification methylase